MITMVPAFLFESTGPPTQFVIAGGGNVGDEIAGDGDAAGQQRQASAHARWWLTQVAVEIGPHFLEFAESPHPPLG